MFVLRCFCFTVLLANEGFHKILFLPPKCTNVRLADGYCFTRLQVLSRVLHFDKTAFARPMDELRDRKETGGRDRKRGRKLQFELHLQNPANATSTTCRPISW